ncbi:MAG TPA: D-aminoacylase [Tissierellia bacterium]|nr:D-aminoacylase [Tissierellia bacterium]
MLDLLIKNGTIIDGTGKKRYNADIGIKGNKIYKIESKIEDVQAKEILDAKGLIVSPGFIDIHGHSDFTLFTNNKGESKIRQGITTEVVGNCGFTAGPYTEEHFDDLIQYLANTIVLDDEQKKNWKWKSQIDFIQDFSKNGLSFNVVPLVGHGTIRVAVMGFDKRKPTKVELNKMIDLLENEMENGLFGLSTGLEYEPGSYSETEELIELCKVVKKYDGIYSTHLKNEGKDLLKCIQKAIEIGRQSGVSVEISHLKAQYKANWGKANNALSMIDKANMEGLNIGFDVYPYIAFGSGLLDLMPPWIKVDGPKKMIQLLLDKSIKEEVINDMQSESDEWENPMLIEDWDKTIKIAMLKTDKNKKYEGCTIREIAEDMGVTPFEAVIKLMIEEEASIKCIYFAMCEDDLETIMKHPNAKFCTDGRAVATYGELSKGSVHPRYYGTYPRIMGYYVREINIISLEEAIQKSTSFPAKKLKIRDRGELKEGYYADITIFDPDRIIDKATFDNPHQYPVGIEYVLVNGKIVINKGEHTGNLPGTVIKR